MESLGLSLGDLSCPICMERLRDPFVTPCGHSFCYSCITTHLNVKSNCPCCSEYLILDRVFPNYLLSKVVSKASDVEALGGRAPIVQQLQTVLADDTQALQIHDVDLLLQLLLEKKQEMQQHETEANLELLLHFLTHSRDSKAKKLQTLQEELCILDKDIHQVETRGHLPAAATILALPAAQQHLNSKLNSPSPSAGQLLLQEAGARNEAVADILGQRLLRPPQDVLKVPRGPADTPVARTLHPGHLVSGALFQSNGHVSAGALRMEQQQRSASHCPPTVVLEHAPSGPIEGTIEVMSSLPATSSSPVASSEMSHPPTSSASEPPQQLRQHSYPPEYRQRALPFAEHPDAMRVSGGYEGRGLSLGVPLAGRFSPDLSAGAAEGSATGTSGGRTAGNMDGGNTTAGDTDTSLARSDSVPAPGPASQGRKRQRFESQFEDLQQCYLRLRCQQEGSAGGSLANSSPLDGTQASKRVRQVEDTATNGGSETVGPTNLISGQAAPAAPSPQGPANGEAAGQLTEAQELGASDARIGSLASTQGGLQEFSRMLSMFTQCSKLKVIAQLPGAGHRASAAILSSIEFDRDARLFATAGVSKRISIFDYQSVVTNCASNNGAQVVQTPAAELLSRSKLSCLAWNRHIEPHLISSDYEGVITLWDAQAGQPVIEYEAHEKRIWSVDFCHTEPHLLVSGSDDGFVKVWSTNQSSSVAQVDMKANVCSVKYSPASSYEMAIGSADHNVHLYDLRNFQRPVYVFSGHRKAVSYVRYLSAKEVVSASTDSTLRLWSTQSFQPVRAYNGHVNEKNFVGLSTDCDFIACGSESSEVFVYYRSMSKPIAKRVFRPPVAPHAAASHQRASMQFISALCWKPMSQTLLAANSQGTINVMQLTS